MFYGIIMPIYIGILRHKMERNVKTTFEANGSPFTLRYQVELTMDLSTSVVYFIE